MDSKDKKYPSFNTPNTPSGHKNANAGQFRTSIDNKPSDIYSDVPSQGRSGAQNGQRNVPGRRSGEFSVKIPSSANTTGQRSTNTTSRPAGTVPAQKSAAASARPRVQNSQPPSRTSAPRTQQSAPASRTSQYSRVTDAPVQRNTTSTKGRGPRITAEEKRLRKEKKRRQRLRSLLALIVCVVFISLITITLSVIAISTINDILCIGKESGVTISVVVEKGDDFETVFNKLCDNGLVAQKQLSHIFCLYRKYDTVKYEPGVYYFDTADGVESMLEEMMVSKKNSNSIVRLTFPEGWSTAKIFQKIEKYEVCSAEKLYANLDIVAQQYKFYEKIKSKNGRYLMTEGYLFPDTYEFYKGESASSVLKKLFKNFSEHWTADYSARAKELGLSMDEVITIASIIQREAGSVAQMKDISSVIHNRLNSNGYRKLQMDSTTDYIYSLNSNFELFSDSDYSLYFEAYNTYSTEGLPPGPICNPGKSAIEAALNPNETSYLFFAHDSNGEIYLASTEAEHQANLSRIFSESNG